MRKSFLYIIAGTLLLCSCGSGNTPESTGFTIKESRQGVELFENGSAVFFYRREAKSGDGEHYFNNYLHPLYSLNGDTLTEEFPPDHLHRLGLLLAAQDAEDGLRNRTVPV